MQIAPDLSSSGEGVIKLLVDRPGDHSGADSARTSELARRLADRFVAYAPDKLGKGELTQCIGLFGGLGQGKTSTVARAKELARTAGVASDHFFEFDVANHGASDLLHRFDSILAALTGGRRATLGWIISVGVFAFLALLSLSWFLALGIDDTKLWQKAIASFSVLAFGGAAWTTGLHAYHRKVLQRVFERTGNLHGPGQVAREVWRWLRRRRPRWLIIDNLDRATISQQRAVLRALHKQRDTLHLHILVCMDTTALLRSSPNPESPGELLRKVVGAEWHMPSRTPADIWRMAGDSIAIAVQLNQSHFPAIEHIAQVSHIAALARVARLMGCHSPRGIKHLVNNALLLLTANWTFERVGVGRAHFLNWDAALRLHGLWTLAPALRDEGPLVAECLAENTPSAFDRLARGCGSSKSAVLRYLTLTRHLRSIGGDWAALTSAKAQRGRNSPPPSSIYGEERQTRVESYERCDVLWAYLLECAQNGAHFSMNDFRARERVSLEATSQDLGVDERRIVQTAFGLAGIAAAEHTDIDQRARLLLNLRQTLVDTTPTVVASYDQMLACDLELAQKLGPGVFSSWLKMYPRCVSSDSYQVARNVRALVTLLPPNWFTLPIALAYAAWNCNMLEAALLPWLRSVQSAKRRARAVQIEFPSDHAIRMRLMAAKSLSTCWPAPVSNKSGQLKKVINTWTELCVIDLNPESNVDSSCPPALTYVLLEAPEFGVQLANSPKEALCELAILLWPYGPAVDPMEPTDRQFVLTRWLALIREARGLSGSRLGRLFEVRGERSFHQRMVQLLVACWLNRVDEASELVADLWKEGGNDAKIGLQALIGLESNDATIAAIGALRVSMGLDER